MDSHPEAGNADAERFGERAATATLGLPRATVIVDEDAPLVWMEFGEAGVEVGAHGCVIRVGFRGRLRLLLECSPGADLGFGPLEIDEARDAEQIAKGFVGGRRLPRRELGGDSVERSIRVGFGFADASPSEKVDQSGPSGFVPGHRGLSALEKRQESLESIRIELGTTDR